jgi:hypothetical protein
MLEITLKVFFTLVGLALNMLCIEYVLFSIFGNNVPILASITIMIMQQTFRILEIDVLQHCAGITTILAIFFWILNYFHIASVPYLK